MAEHNPSLFIFLRTLWRLSAPQRGRLYIGLVLLAVNVAFIVGLPLYYRVMMDDAVIAANSDLLLWMLIGLGAAYLLTSSAAVLQTHWFAKLSATLAADIRQQMYYKVQTLHDIRQESAVVATHFTTDLGALEKWLAQPARVMLIHATVFVTSALLLFWVEWRLALFTYAILPLIALAMKLLSTPTLTAGNGKKQTESRIATFITEEVRANTMLRLFGLNAVRKQHFDTQVEHMRQWENKAAFWSALTGETSIILINLIQVGVFGLGAYLTISGVITLGALIAFVGLMINISNAGITLSQLFPQLFDAATAHSRIEHFMRLEQSQPAAYGTQSIDRLESLEIEQLSFAYRDGREVLKQLSLRVRQGEHIALVGASGSGKSTLLRLIMGLERAGHGSVHFNGTPIGEIAEAALHRRMAAVFQQPLLLDSSIADNIRAGRPDADDEAVYRAAQQAEIHNTVTALEQGYATPVGEAGGKLSGGQQQRIAIARALIRDPDLLLLDEATSALDATTEQALIETLQRVTAGRTVIAVTHRLALAVAMARIIVLEQGRIVEDGSHEQLLQQNGPYARLWNKQHLAHTRPDGSAEIAPDALLQLPPLRALELNRHLDEQALQHLRERFVRESYPAGVVVIRQGEAPDGFRIIARGQVEVVRQDGTAEEKRLAVLEEGDYFGEGALLQGTARTASIRTLTPTLCLTLGSADFLEILQRSPALREQLDTLFRQRLQQR